MSFDRENWVMCNQGDACVSPNLSEESKPLVPRVLAPREAICFPCIEAMAREIIESSGARKDDAVADFRRRVMGLE
jgi:hypothetical protein